MIARGELAEQHPRKNAYREPQPRRAEDHRQSLPPGFGTGFHRWRASAGLEQAQRDIDALAEPDLIEQLRVLAAIALEILCALERQPAAQVTLNDLVARNEFAIHGRGAVAARFGRAYGRCLHGPYRAAMSRRGVRDSSQFRRCERG